MHRVAARLGKELRTLLVVCWWWDRAVRAAAAAPGDAGDAAESAAESIQAHYLHHGKLRFDLCTVTVPKRNSGRAIAIGILFLARAARLANEKAGEGGDEGGEGGEGGDGGGGEGEGGGGARRAIDHVAALLAPHVAACVDEPVACPVCGNERGKLCACEGRDAMLHALSDDEDGGQPLRARAEPFEPWRPPPPAPPKVRPTFPQAPALHNALKLPGTSPALPTAAPGAPAPPLPRFAVDFEFSSCGRQRRAAEQWVFPCEIAVVEVGTGRTFHRAIDPDFDSDVAHLEGKALAVAKQVAAMAGKIHGFRRKRVDEWGGRRDYAQVFADLCAFLGCSRDGPLRLPRVAVKCGAPGGGADLLCLRWMALKAGRADAACDGVVSLRVVDRRPTEARRLRTLLMPPTKYRGARVCGAG